MEPITRKELFLAKAAGMDVKTPEPITREEMFLSRIIGGEDNPQGGGGAFPEVHPFEKMKATLIINKTITKDENGAFPAKVSLSEDDNGNPLELTAFALQSDIKSEYGYTDFGINRIIGNAQAARGFFSIRKTHGRDEIANAVFVSEKGLTTVCGQVRNGIVPDSFAYPYDGYKVREIVFPYSGSIASGTFVKVWKLSAEE